MKTHTAWILLILMNLFGCSSSSVTDQAKTLGIGEFSKEAWSVASQEERGKMVFSFLSQNNLESLTPGRVKELLGNPTGYYDNEGNVAYFVGPDTITSEYGKGYLLVFFPSRDSGNIASVKIIPEPK